MIANKKPSPWYATLSLTVFALACFAANSVLCRLALGQHSIDAASFTVIRMLSAALTLYLIMALGKNGAGFKLKVVFNPPAARCWLAPLMLFTYAACFSFAYIQLDTATGALILFATVQFFMIGYSLLKGHRLSRWEWLGLLVSCAGFVLLMLPGASQPQLSGLLLMVLAGVSWAVYSLEGRQSQRPIVNTAENFIRCLPLTLLLLLASLWTTDISSRGFWLATASGVVASGLGYSLWYMALRHLSITLAAISQLAVPVIAAMGGVVLMDEGLSRRLILASLMILSGIALVSVANKFKARP